MGFVVVAFQSGEAALADEFGPDAGHGFLEDFFAVGVELSRHCNLHKRHPGAYEDTQDASERKGYGLLL